MLITIVSTIEIVLEKLEYPPGILVVFLTFKNFQLFKRTILERIKK